MQIGCGGWQYFEAPGDKLRNYSRIYDFVEVNSTFYNLPEISTVKSWRKKVQDSFKFAIKVNKSITHESPFNITEENMKVINHLLHICDHLKSSYLVFQTPPYFNPTRYNLEKAAHFFEQIVRKKVELLWELRAHFPSSKEKDLLFQTLKKSKVTHVTDIFRSLPLHVEKTFYTRIFGRGKGNKWELSNSEIKDVHSFLQPIKKKHKVVVSFHTMRMENDAARFGEYNKTRSLLSFQKKGIKSVLSTIKELNTYPINKELLLAEHGWKIHQLPNDTEVRLESILSRIQDKQYDSYGDVKKEVLKVYPTLF